MSAKNYALLHTSESYDFDGSEPGTSWKARASARLICYLPVPFVVYFTYQACMSFTDPAGILKTFSVLGLLVLTFFVCCNAYFEIRSAESDPEIAKKYAKLNHLIFGPWLALTIPSCCLVLLGWMHMHTPTDVTSSKCMTVLGECFTISCVAGNLDVRFYVLLLLILLAPVIVVLPYAPGVGVVALSPTMGRSRALVPLFLLMLLYLLQQVGLQTVAYVTLACCPLCIGAGICMRRKRHITVDILYFQSLSIRFGISLGIFTGIIPAVRLGGPLYTGSETVWMMDLHMMIVPSCIFTFVGFLWYLVHVIHIRMQKSVLSCLPHFVMLWMLFLWITVNFVFISHNRNASHARSFNDYYWNFCHMRSPAANPTPCMLPKTVNFTALSEDHASHDFRQKTCQPVPDGLSCFDPNCAFTKNALSFAGEASTLFLMGVMLQVWICLTVYDDINGLLPGRVEFITG